MKPINAETKIKRLVALLKEVEVDCLQLKKQGELTDYGGGQFDLIQIVRKELSL